MNQRLHYLPVRGLPPTVRSGSKSLPVFVGLVQRPVVVPIGIAVVLALLAKGVNGPSQLILPGPRRAVRVHSRLAHPRAVLPVPGARCGPHLLIFFRLPLHPDMKQVFSLVPVQFVLRALPVLRVLRPRRRPAFRHCVREVCAPDELSFLQRSARSVESIPYLHTSPTCLRVRRPWRRPVRLLVQCCYGWVRRLPVAL